MAKEFLILRKGQYQGALRVGLAHSLQGEVRLTRPLQYVIIRHMAIKTLIMQGLSLLRIMVRSE